MGEVSRLVVAEACIQALDIDFTQGQIYEINSVKVHNQIIYIGRILLHTHTQKDILCPFDKQYIV